MKWLFKTNRYMGCSRKISTIRITESFMLVAKHDGHLNRQVEIDSESGSESNDIIKGGSISSLAACCLHPHKPRV